VARQVSYLYSSTVHTFLSKLGITDVAVALIRSAGSGEVIASGDM
jgi:hypothetical protein